MTILQLDGVEKRVIIRNRVEVSADGKSFTGEVRWEVPTVITWDGAMLGMGRSRGIVDITGTLREPNENGKVTWTAAAKGFLKGEFRYLPERY